MTTFSEPNVRLLEASDAERLIQLFTLQYGSNYSYPQMYISDWVRRAVYSDSIVWIGVEADRKLVASGALMMDYGRYCDQLGALGRLVVDPEVAGQGFAVKVINALTEAAQQNAACSIGDARTAHNVAQRLMEKVHYKTIGYVPDHSIVNGKREGLVYYTNLQSTALSLRSKQRPQLIPAAQELAAHSLTKLELEVNFKSAWRPIRAYPTESKKYDIRLLDEQSIPQLLSIKRGRVTEPMIFGNASLDYGLPALSKRKVKYREALDKKQKPVGAIGYYYDEHSRVVYIVELIADRDEVAGKLISHICMIAKYPDWGVQANVIEVNVSAYNARLQETFSQLGFWPAVYTPAMVFHQTERLDALKMVRFINHEYDPSRGVAFTTQANQVASIVEAHIPSS